MIDIEELKRKALASHGGLDAWYTDGQMGDLDPADAEYVVTASPKAVLALIERLEAAEAIAADLRAQQDDYERTHAYIEASEQDAARFRWVMEHAEVIFDKPVRFQQTLCYQTFTRIPDRPYLCTAIDAAIAKGKS